MSLKGKNLYLPTKVKKKKTDDDVKWSGKMSLAQKEKAY